MKVGDVVVPEPDDDPALLSALYAGFSAMEDWRKVVLATCRELIRAGASLDNQKLSEARIDDLARTHPSYLAFLEMSLRGKVLWERNVKDSSVGGYR